MMPRPIAAGPLMLACLSVACGASGLLEPDLGRLRIVVTITGLDADPDGVQVQVNHGPPTTLRQEPRHFTLSSGQHRVVMHGLAPNCQATDGATRDVRLDPGGTAEVGFAVRCTAISGAVEVAVAVDGVDPDPDGILVGLDGGPSQRVLHGTTTRFDPVLAGHHRLTVLDVADNCQVIGLADGAVVTVGAGTERRDTARILMSVRCSPRFGALQVITASTGPSDPDGYQFVLGPPAAPSTAVGTNDTLHLSRVAVGRHAARLVDVEGWCNLSTPPPDSVDVVGGSTTALEYRVTCLAGAAIRVHVTTAEPIVPGEYRLQVDAEDFLRLWPGGQAEITLPEGAHMVGLAGIPDACTVNGPNPRPAVLAAHTLTEIAFEVVCAEAPERTGADIVVSAHGHNPDPLVRIVVCGVAQWDCWAPVYAAPVTTNETLRFALPPGTYYAWFEGVADHCAVVAMAPFVVAAGRVTTQHVDIACAAPTTSGPAGAAHDRTHPEGPLR